MTTDHPVPPARVGGRAILEMREVVKHFPAPGRSLFGRSRGTVRAVDGIDLDVFAGETLAVVGESGCGKSTVGRLMVRLTAPTRGSIVYGGRDVTRLAEREIRPLRRELQIVFQDPFGSLNPRMTVGELLAEPLRVHGLAGRREAGFRVRELLATVGLNADHLDRFPHEFSGGQRQRIGIARALAAGPKLVVGDEPVSALDVSIQAQIINLLQDLKARLALTLVVVSHDLAVVRHLADRIAVMYLGRIVEIADKSALFRAPRHPYTQALLSAVPLPRLRDRGRRPVLEGDVPSPIDPPSGCRFHTRCPHAKERCRLEDPPAHHADGRTVFCHFWQEIAPPAALVETLRRVDPPYQKRLDLYQARAMDAATG